MLHAYVEAVDVHWARENRLARVQSTVERMREDSLVNSGKRRSSSRGLLGRWVSQLCAWLGCEAVVGRWELGWRAESGGGESLPASPAHCPLLSAYQGLRSLLRSCVGLLVSVCVQLLFFVCRRRARPRCGTAGTSSTRCSTANAEPTRSSLLRRGLQAPTTSIPDGLFSAPRSLRGFSHNIDWSASANAHRPSRL